jgi:hypothetical protein
MHNEANTVDVSLPNKTGLMADTEEHEQMPEPSMQDNTPSEKSKTDPTTTTTTTSTDPPLRRSNRLANAMDAF